MQAFKPVVGFVAIVAAAALTASAQADSGSLVASPELAAIAECTSTQLDEGQVVLTSNQRAEQCETALNLTAGTMLQVTTASATEMCDTASCRAALQELYNTLPNCRYDLWGLQYSAMKLLEYCGITPVNASESNSTDSTSGSVGWRNTSGSASFAPVGVPTDDPATPRPAPDSSAGAAPITVVSAAVATTVGLVAAYLA
uniref:Elicitin n=1 Tax=Hyaloperonospora arabidopsidis (strain Emoy2) TaxID=559515 RepID=M4B6M0_HYAAE